MNSRLQLHLVHNNILYSFSLPIQIFPDISDPISELRALLIPSTFPFLKHLAGRISAVDTAIIEFVAGGSWSAISVDPSAVVAGDEPGTLTFHCADDRT